jgi:hypothetical protein
MIFCEKFSLLQSYYKQDLNKYNIKYILRRYTSMYAYTGLLYLNTNIKPLYEIWGSHSG